MKVGRLQVNQRGVGHLGMLLLVAAVVVGVGAIGVFVSRKNVSHAAACPSYVYKYGGANPYALQCVTGIQKMLNYYGMASPALVADGQFGPKTQTAVKNFQAARKLSLVDGIVGLNTWAQLCAPYSGTKSATTYNDDYRKAVQCAGTTTTTTSTPSTPTKETPPNLGGSGKAFGSAYYSDSLRFAPGALNLSFSQDSHNYSLTFQSDGNLVHYDNGRALWASGTNGKIGGGGYLLLKPDCSMAIYDLTNKLVWSTPGVSGSPTKCNLWGTSTASITARVGSAADTTPWRVP